MDRCVGLVRSLLTGGLVLGGALGALAQSQPSDRCAEAAATMHGEGSLSRLCTVAAVGLDPAAGDQRPSTRVLDLSLSRNTMDPAGSGYPYRDPIVATISGAVVNADGITPGAKRQVVHVQVLPDRNQLPGLEGRGVVSVALYRQHHPAPLMVVLPGIGSSGYFGIGTYLAAMFHRAGFHVVILPSPMNWDFALAASRSGAPGYPPEDARDVYATLQRTLETLRGRQGLDIRGVNFVGVSLGALEGAYLSVLDTDEGKVGIERYLLVNPPLDLDYSINTLEEWLALRAKLGAERAARLRGKALAIVESHNESHRSDPADVEKAVEDFSAFTREELQYLIAQYVQMVLPELVYVTQAIHDQHLLAAPRTEVRKRLAEARGFTLKEYTEKVALPVWRREGIAPTGDSAQLNQQGSLSAILDRLRANPRVHVMHTADDILADRASIEELKAAMGSQMTLLPYGGHLGNLWYPPVRDRVLDMFQPVAEARPAR